MLLKNPSHIFSFQSSNLSGSHCPDFLFSCVIKKTLVFIVTFFYHLSMNKKVPKVAILCRVSTEEQDTSRQVSELKALCHEKGWNVVAVVENQESGMKRSLAGLETVKELARKGKIQKVVVSEISRIARRLSVVSKFVEEMEDLKVSIFWQNQGLETLQENGERNGVANIFLAAFAEIARNEREMTVKRIRSGLASAREKGKVLGRPKGSVQLIEDFLSKHKGIVRRVQDGLSFRDISKLEKCSFSTIKKVKAILKVTDSRRI